MKKTTTRNAANVCRSIAIALVALAALTPKTAKADLDGAKLYTDNLCITCHQADGKGTPGTFPPLVGQAVVTGDPDVLIKIVLLGPTKVLPADRPKYVGVMPPIPKMSDAKLAALLTYVRTKFGNGASPVTEDEVAKVRAAVAGGT